MGCGSSTHAGALAAPRAHAGPVRPGPRGPRPAALPVTADAAPRNRLTCIVVHWNPQRYQRRARLFNECVERLAETKVRLARAAAARRVPADLAVGLNVVAVELVYGDLPSELALDRVANAVRVIQRRLPERHVMWAKEQLINLALRSLPADEEHVAWLDGDIGFESDAWVEETVRVLRADPLGFGQPWDTCTMLGPNNERLERVTSFSKQHSYGKKYRAWCTTTQALRKVNGLIEKTLGSADLHMAASVLGLADLSIPSEISAAYRDSILQWQSRALEAGLRLVVVPNQRIHHFFHGAMRNRQYVGRWRVLVEHEYDPARDVEWRPDLGLYVWSDAAPQDMIDATCEYFRGRREDSDAMDQAGPEGDDERHHPHHDGGDHHHGDHHHDERGGDDRGDGGSSGTPDDGRGLAFDPPVDPLTALPEYWNGYA